MTAAAVACAVCNADRKGQPKPKFKPFLVTPPKTGKTPDAYLDKTIRRCLSWRGAWPMHTVSMPPFPCRVHSQARQEHPPRAAKAAIHANKSTFLAAWAKETGTSMPGCWNGRLPRRPAQGRR